MNNIPIEVLEEKLNDMFYDSLEISDQLEDKIIDKEKKIDFLKDNIQYIGPFTYLIISNKSAFISLVAALISLLLAPVSVLLPIKFMFFIVSIIFDILSYNFLNDEEKNILKNTLKEIKFNLKHSPQKLFKNKSKRKVIFNSCDSIIELEKNIVELNEKLEEEKGYQIKIIELLERINNLKKSSNTTFIPTEALFKTSKIETSDRSTAIKLLEKFKIRYFSSKTIKSQSKIDKCILFKRES